MWSIVDITTPEIRIQNGMSMMMSRATVLCGAPVATSYVAVPGSWRVQTQSQITMCVFAIMQHLSWSKLKGGFILATRVRDFVCVS